MRVAYLSTDLGIPYGGTKGASVHVGEITAALATGGAEVLALVATVEPGAAPSPGVAVEVLPGPAKGAPVEERLAADVPRAAWLERRLGEFGADVLIERVALYSVAGSAAARACGIPHVLELNAPLPVEAAAYRRLEQPDQASALEQQVLYGADLVLAVSRPLAEYARERGATRVEVLPNAVDVSRFPRRVKVRADRAVAVFSAGRLRPWHGTDVIAEAWRMLDSDAPRLLVIGDGEGRAALEEVGASVIGAVPHDQVPALLMGGDIGLAPYAPDAPRYFSPLKLFEYLAAGLAVVAGSLPGVTDVVDETTAVTIPPGDAAALAAAVAELAADGRRRASLGRAGRALVTRRHTWTQRSRRIMELVDELRRAGSTVT